MTPVDLGGSRHAASGARPPQGFRCPACGKENIGPLSAGCTFCGSGQPGEHVGVPPPAPAALQASGPTPQVEYLWLEWMRPLRGKYDGATEALLLEAYKAGYYAAMAQTSSMGGPALTGTAESRTVIAALRFFIEQVLVNAKEEIQAGEYLSIAETERLIQKFERIQ